MHLKTKWFTLTVSSGALWLIYQIIHEATK